MAAREALKIVPPGKKKCVWMEANVVSYKLCDNNYDCSTCAYDHAMQDKVARYKETVAVQPVAAESEKFTETWVDKMMKMPASQRKCRYMISGELDRKLCPNAYECGTCSFDQMMQERLQNEILPVHAQAEVGGFELAEDFYYHDGHTWARTEHGGRIRVGLDDFAQKLIGNIAEVELPAIGQEVRQGEGRHPDPQKRQGCPASVTGGRHRHPREHRPQGQPGHGQPVPLRGRMADDRGAHQHAQKPQGPALR